MEAPDDADDVGDVEFVPRIDDAEGTTGCGPTAFGALAPSAAAAGGGLAGGTVGDGAAPMDGPGCPIGAVLDAMRRPHTPGIGGARLGTTGAVGEACNPPGDGAEGEFWICDASMP